MKFNLKLLGLGLVIILIIVIYFMSLPGCEYYINNKKVNKNDFFRLKGSANSSTCNANYGNVCGC